MFKTKNTESQAYGLARQLIAMEREIAGLQARVDQADAAAAGVAGDDAEYEKAAAAVAELRGQRARLMERASHLQRAYRDAAEQEKAALVKKLEERKTYLETKKKETGRAAVQKRADEEARHQQAMDAIDNEVSRADAAVLQVRKLMDFANAGYSEGDVSRLDDLISKRWHLSNQLRGDRRSVELEDLRRSIACRRDKITNKDRNRPPGAGPLVGPKSREELEVETSWLSNLHRLADEIKADEVRLEELQESMSPLQKELSAVQNKIDDILKQKPEIAL